LAFELQKALSSAWHPLGMGSTGGFGPGLLQPSPKYQRPSANIISTSAPPTVVEDDDGGMCTVAGMRQHGRRCPSGPSPGPNTAAGDAPRTAAGPAAASSSAWSSIIRVGRMAVTALACMAGLASGAAPVTAEVIAP